MFNHGHFFDWKFALLIKDLLTLFLKRPLFAFERFLIELYQVTKFEQPEIFEYKLFSFLLWIALILILWTAARNLKMYPLSLFCPLIYSLLAKSYYDPTDSLSVLLLFVYYAH